VNIDALPIWVVFAATVLLVLGSIEVGFRLGSLVLARASSEKEAPVSGVSGAILALTAFMLAFTMSMVAERYDARKALVRSDAVAIRTAYMRSDFLPPAERSEAKDLIRQYLALRLSFARAASLDQSKTEAMRAATERIQRRLWALATANAARDMNSDIAALYIESLNEMFDVNAQRVAVGLQARIPMGVWLVLVVLTIFGMMSIGYHTGIIGSRRSLATLILAVAFAMVIVVIAALDRPGGYVPVTQQPLEDAQRYISGGD